MKERPILFSAPMVRALLPMVRALESGAKTQTRRIMKPQPVHRQIHEHRGRLLYEGEHRMWCWRSLVLENIWDFPNGDDRKALAACSPYGVPGDRLWVRETWAPRSGGLALSKIQTPFYRATDGEGDQRNPWRWRPSIHMPRWASRITLEITDVRVQRLQEISEEDAHAEGCRASDAAMVFRDSRRIPEFENSARGAFVCLWESINGGGAWDANPWVWAITFNQVTP